MRSLLLLFFSIFTAACVGAPPVPCTTCGDKCVDTQTDSKNCGGCGMACNGGQLCSAGNCVTTCASGQDVCNGKCTNTATDSLNCHMCGHACPSGQVCSSGACQTSCGNGYNVCTDDGGTEYCADITSSSKDCSSCGHACGPSESCVSGICTSQCGPGRSLCTPPSGPPACTDENTDPSNCGACNQACPAGLTCNGGHCDSVCNAPLTSCVTGLGVPAHFCSNLQSDSSNCGACGNACPPATTCVSGACVGALASSCDQLHSLLPSQTDSDVTLYLDGKWYSPYRAYCADMDGGNTRVVVTNYVLTDDAGTRLKDDAGIYRFTNDSGVVLLGGDTPGPKTYFTLTETGFNQNSGMVRLGPPWPPFLQNNWTKLRYDPTTRLVHTDDFRFATTYGITQNSSAVGAELGLAGACSNGALPNGTANIDVRGTVFAINPGNVWFQTGTPPSNFSATFSAANEVVNVTGNGNCGDYSLNANTLAGQHRLLLDPIGGTCLTMHQMNPTWPSGAYNLFDNTPADGGNTTSAVYCDMTNSGGGWTLIMKIDGRKTDSRFFFSDPLWTNEQLYNAANPDLSAQEAKYASYMATAFTQVYIITVDALNAQHSAILNVPLQRSMLQAQLSPFVAFTNPGGPGGWATLMGQPGGTLQPFCQREGLNNAVCVNCRTQVRMGILDNEQNDCGSPDSYSGIGGELVPANDCTVTKPAGFRGYSAGQFGAPNCPMAAGGSADTPVVAYIYVR